MRAVTRRQCVDTGLADELIIHLAPVVLGAGTPLLVDCHPGQLVQRDVRDRRPAPQVVVAPVVLPRGQGTGWAMESSLSLVPPGPVAWMLRWAESGSLG